ncbi:hypothetical protein COY27_05625 [Candidatus Woesearchaeota archaeon CG_4_10_14_0_2_um_filter_33_13]|nr:MAG: hypothetical protein COY27_05625 [Candidatus Woesearchaeota archaeon CG_4_10_14_0_2_um_filter_33_13]
MTTTNPHQTLDELLSQGTAFRTVDKTILASVSLQGEAVMNPNILDDLGAENAYEVNLNNVRYQDGMLIGDLTFGRYIAEHKVVDGTLVTSYNPDWEETIRDVEIFSQGKFKRRGIKDNGKVDYALRDALRSVAPETILDPVMDRLFAPIETTLVYLAQSLGIVDVVEAETAEDKIHGADYQITDDITARNLRVFEYGIDPLARRKVLIGDLPVDIEGRLADNYVGRKTGNPIIDARIGTLKAQVGRDFLPEAVEFEYVVEPTRQVNRTEVAQPIN